MTNQLLEAFAQLLSATTNPDRAIRQLRTNPRKMSIALAIVFIFAVLYASTAFLLYIAKIPPALAPWLPATLLAIFFSKANFPMLLETFRLTIIPPLWQTAITAIGLRQTHDTGWLKDLGIGLVTVLASFLMLLAFMR